jgi:predicted RNase H-like HicB family nuclease
LTTRHKKWRIQGTKIRSLLALHFGFRWDKSEQKKESGESMKLKVIVHEAEEGGYWAEVPAIPGCATQGETFDELLKNLYDAVEGCLSVDVKDIQISGNDKVLDIAV